MKKLIYIISIAILAINISCEPTPLEANFEDAESRTIFNYVHDSTAFSSFLAILEKGGLDKTLSAYNPDGTNYTLFLPDNNAINDFIAKSDLFASLESILANEEYAAEFCRYHVVNEGIHTNNFPFGAFSEPTLSNDFLTVSFIIETDTAYYKINNQAPVIKPNIELSNGYVHIIQTALNPITFTSYEWIKQNSEYSIFTEALEKTGVVDIVNRNLKQEENIQAVTVLLEPNEIYKQSGINSFADLANRFSPDRQDYTDVSNPLYNFVAYHVLTGNFFIDDFEGTSTNYTTYGEVPLQINGQGIDIIINKGKQAFDTIIVQGDTTIIDYIGFDYDKSNVSTQSGAIHIIDRVMPVQKPSRAIRTFEFWEEPYLNTLRNEPGTYLLDKPEALYNISWNTGIDMFFVEGGDANNGAWGNDYLMTNGDFSIFYTIPRVVQGKYDVILRAERFSSQNALIEVFMDGKKIGGIVDLTTGGSASNPFQSIELGSIDFKKYKTHIIEVRSLIPGRFLWDTIRFEPI